jgi:hypothetical protein
VDLVFTGAVTGVATALVDEQPKVTTSNFDEDDADALPWATRCVFDGDGTTAWSAAIVVETPGNE